MQAPAEIWVFAVAAENQLCWAVTERREVYSWGRDHHGQCKHGSDRRIVLLPRGVGSLACIRVSRASAGNFHSLVVTEEVALYSFGYGGEGQLGHGDHEDLRSPKMVEALRHFYIVATAAGGFRFLALAEDGTVFFWGYDIGG